MVSKQKAQTSHKELAAALAAATTTDQTSRYQQAVEEAERINVKLENKLARASQKLSRVEAELKAQHNSAQRLPGAKARARVKTARDRVRGLTREAREARKLVKESRMLLRGAEREQRALTRALIEFLNKWQKDYDKQHALPSHNTKVRHRWLKNSRVG